MLLRRFELCPRTPILHKRGVNAVAWPLLWGVDSVHTNKRHTSWFDNPSKGAWSSTCMIPIHIEHFTTPPEECRQQERRQLQSASQMADLSADSPIASSRRIPTPSSKYDLQPCSINFLQTCSIHPLVNLMMSEVLWLSIHVRFYSLSLVGTMTVLVWPPTLLKEACPESAKKLQKICPANAPLVVYQIISIHLPTDSSSVTPSLRSRNSWGHLNYRG